MQFTKISHAKLSACNSILYRDTKIIQTPPSASKDHNVIFISLGDAYFLIGATR